MHRGIAVSQDCTDAIVVKNPSYEHVFNVIRCRFDELVDGSKCRIILLFSENTMHMAETSNAIRELIMRLDFQISSTSTLYTTLERRIPAGYASICATQSSRFQ